MGDLLLCEALPEVAYLLTQRLLDLLDVADAHLQEASHQAHQHKSNAVPMPAATRLRQVLCRQQRSLHLLLELFSAHAQLALDIPKPRRQR